MARDICVIQAEPLTPTPAPKAASLPRRPSANLGLSCPIDRCPKSRGSLLKDLNPIPPETVDPWVEKSLL